MIKFTEVTFVSRSYLRSTGVCMLFLHYATATWLDNCTTDTCDVCIYVETTKMLSKCHNCLVLHWIFYAKWFTSKPWYFPQTIITRPNNHCPENSHPPPYLSPWVSFSFAVRPLTDTLPTQTHPTHSPRCIPWLGQITQLIQCKWRATGYCLQAFNKDTGLFHQLLLKRFGQLRFG